MKIRLLVVALTLAFSGCSSDSTYSGEYFYNFENAIFTPDGSSETWCLEGDVSEAELPATHSTGPWGTSQVVIRGKLGPEGKFGNLGRCKRVLTVTELVAVSNMRGRGTAP